MWSRLRMVCLQFWNIPLNTSFLLYSIWHFASKTSTWWVDWNIYNTCLIQWISVLWLSIPYKILYKEAAVSNLCALLALVYQTIHGIRKIRCKQLHEVCSNNLLSCCSLQLMGSGEAAVFQMDQGALWRSKCPLLCDRRWARRMQRRAGYEVAIHQDWVPTRRPSQVPRPRHAHSPGVHGCDIWVIKQRWLTNNSSWLGFLLRPPVPMEVWSEEIVSKEMSWEETCCPPSIFTLAN